MATTTLLDAYLDALVANLSARIGLDGVTVTSGWVGDDGGLKSIQFQNASTLYDWSSIGRGRHKEETTITGFIFVTASGAGESAIKASRDLAFSIYDELIDELRTNPSQGIAQVQSNTLPSSREDEWAVNATGERATRITFDLGVTFQIIPT